MSVELKYSDIAQRLARQASQTGVLLVSGKTPNPMTMGWCASGVMWNMEVFMAPVRESRYTHGLIDECKKFVVCLPKDRKTLSFCGTHSGRDTDKLAECGFSAVPCRQLDIPAIDGCELYVECEVIGKSEMDINEYAPVASKCYSDGDMHTLYFGKIVAAYEK